MEHYTALTMIDDDAASGGPVHPAECGEHGGPRGGGRPDHHGQLHVRTQGPAQPIHQVTLKQVNRILKQPAIFILELTGIVAANFKRSCLFLQITVLIPNCGGIMS